jgi:hypothetical protein
MINNQGNTFGAAGAGKIPHALAIHAPQALPLLAWLLMFTSWDERRRTGTVLAGFLGYVAVLGASAFQAYSGRAPLDFGVGAGLLFFAGTALVAGAFLRALVALGQGSARLPAAART